MCPGTPNFMSNTSATGGFLQPSPQPLYPGGLTFKQFLQSMFVGISALPGDLVRPLWQKNPPKQPDIDVNWLAIGLKRSKADTNIFIGQLSDGSNQTFRCEDIEIPCTFYGPDCEDILELVRDNFQIHQNLEAITSALMGFVEAGEAIHVPDLVNERWIDRYEMTVFMRRAIIRNYPILTFVSASGIIHTDLSVGTKTLPWNSGT